MSNCPCCGGSVESIPFGYLTNLHLTKGERKIVSRLVKHHPNGAYMSGFIADLYDNDPTGGAEQSDNVARVFIARIRGKIAPYNLGVKYKGGKYHLVQKEIKNAA